MPRIPVAEPSILLTPETKRRIIKEMENNVCLSLNKVFKNVLINGDNFSFKVDPTKDSSEKKEVYTCSFVNMYMYM